MSVSLPIPNRNLQVAPLKEAEIQAMLAAYAATALSNVSSDPITSAFAAGLQTFLSNRRGLLADFRQYQLRVTHEANQLDEYGNAAKGPFDNL